MTKYSVVFEGEVTTGSSDLFDLGDLVMEILEDADDVEDPFVYTDAGNRMMTIEIVIDADTRSAGLSTGIAIIQAALERAQAVARPVALRSDVLVPA